MFPSNEIIVSILQQYPQINTSHVGIYEISSGRFTVNSPNIKTIG